MLWIKYGVDRGRSVPHRAFEIARDGAQAGHAEDAYTLDHPKSLCNVLKHKREF
jgi:hypothetical protein